MMNQYHYTPIQQNKTAVKAKTLTAVIFYNCQLAALTGDASSKTSAASSSSFGSGSRQPAGAVIVAQGAGSVAVRLELLRAAEALLGLSAQEVEVFAMEASP